ncbi:acetyl-CoA synthetase [Gammaproteobacteria bacterium]|nr:acetyl-CoA synthetase [Gammaproteobacteria bacterium]
MTDINKVSRYAISEQLKAMAIISKDQYNVMYAQSIQDPDTFWGERADEFLDFYKKWDTVSDCNLSTGDIKWFEGGLINVSYNCLDRHLPARANQAAIIWEGDHPSESRIITYKELHTEVCQLANGLKSLGIKRGDRVCIYLSMIPEAAIAMLACARIGAMHSVVFGGFSADALKDRIIDAQCSVIITADEIMRGGRKIPLKTNADRAIEGSGDVVKHLIVIKRTGTEIKFNPKDIWYHDLINEASSVCEPEQMPANAPLFVLYTSGSTGKPKGVVHSSAGYLLYASTCFKYIFDYREGEVFWSTADVGWITGHSMVVYAPLANGATTLMFEGVPTFPTSARLWEIVDKYQVNIFYSAPTVIRALMRDGEEIVKTTARKSLRLLGTAGEPINPEAWEWYYRVIGDSRCPIVDTWWQTETGGPVITPLIGVDDLKPGSTTSPFFGIKLAILDADGNELVGACEGSLMIKNVWPATLQTIYNDHTRFIQTYLKPYPGYFLTGDGAKRDEDGYYWITGRIDDVINVSGHRMGTAEIESALVLHPAVAEAAVVGYPHDLKGQGIYAYITLMGNITPTDELKKELVAHVRKEIGPIATPDTIQWAEGLPKTRSGKIMRRILRKIAANELEALGDTSTLADPAVVTELIENRIVI